MCLQFDYSPISSFKQFLEKATPRMDPGSLNGIWPRCAQAEDPTARGDVPTFALGPLALALSLLLGCSGDLVSRLSSGPYRAYYGLLWWFIGDTKWTY